MKYRTYTRLLALALSLTLLTACGPKGESGSQSNPDGSVSSSQGSVSTPDASQPDLSLPESSQPDASQPDASQPNKDQGDSSKPQVEEPAVKKSLSLNSSDFSLFKAGAAYQLKAESKPEKGTYTWTSDNEAVATVSNKGLVTAVAPGTATVTVTDSKTGLSASCIVRCKLEGFHLIAIHFKAPALPAPRTAAWICPLFTAPSPPIISSECSPWRMQL